MTQAADTRTQEHLAQLRQTLAQHFSKDELRSLCADLGIGYESVPEAPTIEGMARELVAYCDRHARLHDPEAVIVARAPQALPPAFRILTIVARPLDVGELPAIADAWAITQGLEAVDAPAEMVILRLPPSSSCTPGWLAVLTWSILTGTARSRMTPAILPLSARTGRSNHCPPQIL